jgi:outer membrane immunogenic protein
MKLLGMPIAAAAFASLSTISLLSGGAPARAAPIFNWTGCYIGASAGGTWGKAEVDFAEAKPNGSIVGGQFGCDYHGPSNWLVGLQGEFNWADARDHQDYILTPIGGGTFETRIDWFASATARLGYAAGPWLIYGKGGAAWVRDRLKDVGSFIGPFAFDGETTRSGWTAGGGVELALAPNWSAILKYDYYGFGRKSVSIPGVDFLGPGAESMLLKQNFSVVRVGINYRFSTSR